MSEQDNISTVKAVEYKILSINEDRGVAKVRFVNPFRNGKDDETNVDTEREVVIPINDDGIADTELFKVRLEQHALAQYNKMEINAKSASKSEVDKKKAFADILKLDKNIEIVNDAAPTKNTTVDPEPEEKPTASKKAKTSSK